MMRHSPRDIENDRSDLRDEISLPATDERVVPNCIDGASFRERIVIVGDIDFEDPDRNVILFNETSRMLAMRAGFY